MTATRTWGRWGPRPTDVACPGCGEGRLVVRISCTHASVSCDGCGASFAVADLTRRLGPEEFALIAEAVGDRGSDRV